MLSQGAKPNLISRDGLSPLHIAAQHGNNATVDALLNAESIKVDLVNPTHGVHSFLTAVKYGYHEVVEKLISRRANVKHINNVADSALHIAAEYGYEKIISLILKNDADARSYMSPSGATPQFRAAAYGREQALRLLLENNTQHINRQNVRGNTALHQAVKFGRMATVKILLAHHANTEVFNQSGESPLHLATKFNRQDIVRELIRHGADVTCKNKSGETPLTLAQKHFDKSLLACFDEKIPQILCKL